MSEIGKIYTAGKNFTLPPAVAALTNLTSVNKPLPSQTFFPMFEKRGGAWYAWLFLQGIQEEADRY